MINFGEINILFGDEISHLQKISDSRVLDYVLQDLIIQNRKQAKVLNNISNKHVDSAARN